MRTADSIEQGNSQKEKPLRTARVSAKSLANLKPFPPGVSGNPSGKPKGLDHARAVARKIFETEGNDEEIYRALGKALLKGNAYVFKELAERAYGKIKEVHEHSFEHRTASDEELQTRLAELTEKK